MRKRSSPLSARNILRLQAIGFITIALLSVANEVFYVPHYFFGEPKQIVWVRLLGRLCVLTGIWALVHLSTRRLLKRLHELEDFLLICSWCRRVGDRGEWLSVEQFFDSKFKTGTSHGICPDCAQRELEQHRKHLAERVKSTPKPPA